MPRLRLRLFGRSGIDVNDRACELTPTANVVFVRLLIADGKPVTVDQIYRDIWSDSGLIDREGRTRVQRRILEIRETVDPDNPGEKSTVVRTERGRITAYRSMLARDDIDVFQFMNLVTRARREAPDEKIALLQRALALWTGSPLSDVADLPWAAQTVHQLTELRKSAMRDL